VDGRFFVFDHESVHCMHCRLFVSSEIRQNDTDPSCYKPQDHTFDLDRYIINPPIVCVIDTINDFTFYFNKINCIGFIVEKLRSLCSTQYSTAWVNEIRKNVLLSINIVIYCSS